MASTPTPSPAPHFDGRSGEDARFQRLAPQGRVRVQAPAARPELWPGRQLAGGSEVREAGAPAAPHPERQGRPRPGSFPLGPSSPSAPGTARWEHVGPSGAQSVEISGRSCPNQRPFSERPDLARRQATLFPPPLFVNVCIKGVWVLFFVFTP